MKLRSLIAAIILGATALLHLIGGEVTVHRPLLARMPTAELALYVTLLWHFVSMFLIWGAVVIGLSVWRPARWGQAAWHAAILCMGMGALFFALGVFQLGSIWTAPQWVLLLPVAALVMWPKARA